MAVKELRYLWSFGIKRAEVKVSQAQGAGGGWQIMVNNFYQGNIVKLGDEYVYQPNTDRLLPNELIDKLIADIRMVTPADPDDWSSLD